MIYRRLDENGDFSFGRGSGDFISGTLAVAQAIKTKLMMLKGEWWENTEDGLQAIPGILGANGSPESLAGADLLIQARIFETPGVISITDYTSVLDSNRDYYVSCTAETSFGDATISVTF